MVLQSRQYDRMLWQGVLKGVVSLYKRYYESIFEDCVADLFWIGLLCWGGKKWRFFAIFWMIRIYIYSEKCLFG